MGQERKDGGPAFPVPDGEAANHGCHGLTMRDWFAPHAPITVKEAWAIWCKEESHPFDKTFALERERVGFWHWFTALRCEHADAMLAAREQDK